MGLFKDCGCGCNGKKQQDKLVISIISALTFFVIANPEAFRVVRRVLGSRIATPTGCPSTLGLAMGDSGLQLEPQGLDSEGTLFK